MEEYKLRKVSTKKLVIERYVDEFNDSYNEVHIRPYYISKMVPSRLGLPLEIKKETTEDVFNYFYSYIKKVNKHKIRVEVPTHKRVTQQIRGASLLRRNQARTEIVLQFRERGVVTNSVTFSSRNVLPLTDGDSRDRLTSWYCYHNFYKRTGYNGGPAYYIDPTHPDWEFFKEAMDSNYDSLVGIDYSYRPRVKPEQGDYLNQISLALAETGTVPFMQIVKDLAEEGLCKVDGEEVYDKEGHWKYSVSEFEVSDPEAYQIFSLLEYLGEADLRKALEVVERYLTFDLTDFQ